MERIHHKIGRALFCALTVSLLLSACSNPNTPTPNPDGGQQSQQGQNGGGSGDSGDSGGGGGSSGDGSSGGGGSAPVGSYGHIGIPPLVSSTPEEQKKATDGAPPSSPSVSETIKVKIKSISADIASTAKKVDLAPYAISGSGQEETVTVDVLSAHANYLTQVKEAMAKKVKEAITAAGGISPAESDPLFFKANDGTIFAPDGSEMLTNGTVVNVFLGQTP